MRARVDRALFIMPVSDQGATSDRYTIIPRVLIFLRRRRKYLLLRGASTKRLWANKYNGVGGHVEPGEDLLSAAHRELLEETGLTSFLSLCGILMVNTENNPGIGIFVFVGECLDGDPTPSAEGTLEWVDKDSVSQLPAVEDLPVILNLIESRQPGDPPFMARSFYGSDGKLIVITA